jgi:hypothetical protein
MGSPRAEERGRTGWKVVRSCLATTTVIRGMCWRGLLPGLVLFKLVHILFSQEWWCHIWYMVTIRNTVIGCALSEVVLREPHLKHYQQRFISSCPFQLLGAGLSEVVLHVELLLIILWIISSGSCSKPLSICELSVVVQNMNRCQ